MSPVLVWLFAIAGCFAVGNGFLSQPLLADLAAYFHIPEGTASLLVTASQVGYTAGLLLLVPTGDILNRRRLLPLATLIASLALAGAALAPSFWALIASLVVLGVFSTGGQIIFPLAGDLAAPEERARVLATIASGLVSGILVSRALSGLLADLFGWRFVYGLAALVTFLMSVLLWLAVPEERRPHTLSYGQLLASLVSCVRDYPVVRLTLVFGMCSFGVFSLFWTGITFVLSAAPFHYSLSQIGLVGIAGLAGAMAAKNAGLLSEHGHATGAQGVALLFALAALALAGIFDTSIIAILIAVVVIDASLQTVSVLNQIRLMAVAPPLRSRMNSCYIAANFIGAAIGSALAGTLWTFASWPGIMIMGGLMILLSLLIWAVARKEFDKY